MREISATAARESQHARLRPISQTQLDTYEESHMSHFSCRFMSTRAAIALAVGALLGTQALAGGTNQTAQGIMVNLRGGGHFVLQDTQQWRYDSTAAAAYFTNTLTPGSTPTCSVNQNYATLCSTTAPPPAPAPDPNQTDAAVKTNECTFFAGGALSGGTYTQPVRQSVPITGTNKSVWLTWTFYYSIIPTTATVAAYTAWVAGPIQGPTVANVVFTADIAGESVVVSKQFPDPGKFSFSLNNSDGTSRISGLTLTVSDSGGLTVASAVPNATINYPVDFIYTTNAGSNGFTSWLKNGDDMTILNTDRLAGNNNGGADGSAAALATTDDVQVSLSPGSYTATLTGTVKDNSGLANLPINVAQNLKIMAQQCTP